MPAPLLLCANIRPPLERVNEVIHSSLFCLLSRWRKSFIRLTPRLSRGLCLWTQSGWGCPAWRGLARCRSRDRRRVGWRSRTASRPAPSPSGRGSSLRRVFLERLWPDAGRLKFKNRFAANDQAYLPHYFNSLYARRIFISLLSLYRCQQLLDLTSGTWEHGPIVLPPCQRR